MKILPIFVLLACVAWQAGAQDDEAPRPVVSRGLLKRGQNPRGKVTTSTTTPAPLEEAEYEDEGDYPAEENEPSSEAPPSSTEGKKLVGGGVRPFRSNADLLESLKRRRQQAAEAKTRTPSNSEQAAAPEAPVESPKSNYNTATRSIQPDAVEEFSAQPAPAPAPASRVSRFSRPRQ